MLKGIVKEYVAPLLKRHGFKKKDMIWNKHLHGVIQVADFQLSRFNDDDKESFTINLGVFDPVVWERCWGKSSPKFVKADDCFPRLRIGQLLGDTPTESVDHWWSLNSETDEEVLGKKITELLERKCLPFLGQMSDYRRIIEFYNANTLHLMPIEKIYLAIIQNVIGNISSSNALLNDVTDNSKAWANRVNIVRSNLA